jgi:ATP-binding protein involved in chromosome partitioning
MVSTPQKVALQVTRRGATMLQKLKVPVIGIVQNMTSVVCPNCFYKVPLFKNEMENLTNELSKKKQDKT